MNKIIQIFLLLCVLFLGMSIASADGNFTDLNNTINDNSVGNNVILHENYLYNSTSDQDFINGVVISKDNFVLDGGSYTIDGNNTARIFNITGNNVTIKNINLINGFTNNSGGAIYKGNMGTLNIENSSFTNNNAGLSGGAIHQSYTMGTVGHGGVLASSYINIIDSLFSDNKANTTGGAIHISAICDDIVNRSSSNTTITVTNSFFLNNHANMSGGAIYISTNVKDIDNISNDNQFITITNSSFSDNTANMNGGAIHSISNIHRILNGNSRTTMIIDNSSFSNNNANISGGAIYSNYNVTGVISAGSNSISNITITKSNFSNNTATKGNGGAIYNRGNTNSPLNASYSVFYNNGANGTDETLFIGSGNGIISLDYNFWGNNSPKFDEIIKTSRSYTINNFIIVNLIIDSQNNTLHQNEYLKYHIAITLNDTTSFDISKMAPIYVTLKNDTEILYVLLAQQYATVGYGNQIIPVPNNYTLSLYYFSNFLNNQTLLIKYFGNVIVNLNDNYSFYYNETIKINGTISGLDSGDEINLTLSINGTNYTNRTINGEFNFYLPVLIPDNYSFEVDFNGTDDYGAGSATSILIIKKLNPKIFLDYNSNNFTYGFEFLLNITLSYNINGEGVMSNNDPVINWLLNYENGFENIINTNLIVGTYNFTITFKGNEIFNNASENLIVNVNKATPVMNITYHNIIITENAIVIVSLPDLASGNVTITGNGINKTQEIRNGKVNFTLEGLDLGRHYFNISYTGDDRFYPINQSIRITVTKSNETFIDIENTNISASENQTLVINTNPSATGNITLIINNETVTRQINNGTVIFDINHLEVGNYTAEILYSGDLVFIPVNETLNFTISKGDVNLIADNIVMFFRNGTQYIVKLTDSKGNPLANETIQITINGKLYQRITNAEGIATLNINLNPGNYSVMALFMGNERYNSNNTTIDLEILSTIVSEDLIKYYLNESQFEVTILNGTGNPLVNTFVSFNINGQIYNRATDNRGIAKLNINLFPGDYIITTSYNGLSIGNKISVLPTLIGENLVKKFNEAATYNVKVLNGQGLAYKNQVITINIHGKIYEKISNDEGIAKLNINLNPGSYIATATWNGYSTSNNITVLV